MDLKPRTLAGTAETVSHGSDGGRLVRLNGPQSSADGNVVQITVSKNRQTLPPIEYTGKKRKKE